MGTGGGEFLLSLNHPPQNMSATESWPPNIKLCLEKLAPLGIRVFPVQEDAHLPIEDDSFDIVINRHESYDLHEVRRILKPGGMFITQQVGGDNCIGLMKHISLEMPAYQAFSLEKELPKLLNGLSRSFRLRRISIGCVLCKKILSSTVLSPIWSIGLSSWPKTLSNRSGTKNLPWLFSCQGRFDYFSASAL